MSAKSYAHNIRGIKYSEAACIKIHVHLHKSRNLRNFFSYNYGTLFEQEEENTWQRGNVQK